MSTKRGDFRWKPPDENRSKTPSWKEIYRQRCMDRLRDNRFKHLLSKRRSGSSTSMGDVSDEDEVPDLNKQCRREKMVKDIQTMMASEWELIQREDAAEKGIVPDSIPAPSVDEMIALMEEILDELRHEKYCHSNEEDFCEEYAQQEEEELCQAFHRINAIEVICPICQKNSLEEGPGFISCQCGLHINTEQDCISLKHVSDNLQSGTAEHDLQCDQKPSFSQMDDFGISTLIMKCQACDFHYIIV